MLKKTSLFLIITISISIMFWAGRYVFNKQSKSIDYNSYIISDSASIFFIPNANNYLKTKHNQHSFLNFNFPLEINKANSLLLSLDNYNFNSTISSEIYLSYTKSDFSIVFKNYDLTIETIINELLTQLKISAVTGSESINFNDSKFYYKKDGDFFIFSTQEINPTKTKHQIPNKGNFDYHFQNNILERPIYYKQGNNEAYEFTTYESYKTYGKGINPEPYYKIIPSDFEDLYLYGSTRIQEDINPLLNRENEDNFFSWIENGIIYLKKDSLELIIGVQNNQQNLKYILDEQTLELTKDSLLPTPIFKNNFEISFFKSNYNWKSIVPESKKPFNVYTELSNYNILANSMEAMNWYIKEIQLGNTFQTNSLHVSIPTKINKLYINQHDSVFQITIDNWINNTFCFHSKIIINTNSESNSNSIPLESNFLVNQTFSQLSSFSKNDSTYILLSNSTLLVCYDIYGNLLWNKNLKSPLLKKPTEINFNNTIYLTLFMENQIDIIDIYNVSLKGFPYEYNATSKDGIIIRYKDNNDYRIIINTNNQLINLGINGKPVEGWQPIKFDGHLKSNIHYGSTNGKDYIYFKDSYDTLHILNRRGENIFNHNFKFESNNESPYITGDITKNNLRVLNYENGYIKSKFLNDGHLDSLKINQTITSNKVKWIRNNEKTELLVEAFDHLIMYNEFGLVENEIQKPQPNLTHIQNNEFDRNLIVFGNLPKNQLYLLNRFGTLINSKPINGNSTFTFVDGIFIVYFNSQIWVYNLN